MIIDIYILHNTLYELYSNWNIKLDLKVNKSKKEKKLDITCFTKVAHFYLNSPIKLVLV